MYYMDVKPDFTRLESLYLMVLDCTHHADVEFTITRMDPQAVH